MPKIRFSHNWNNKLSGKVFTTIRKWDAEKADYYLRSKGLVFTILLNEKVFGSAKLLEVVVEDINDIAEIQLILDTGLTSQREIMALFKKFGVKDKVVILLFEKLYDDDLFTVLQEDDGDV